MDKLATVRKKFISSLPEKAAELDAAMASAATEESLGNLRALVHKIAGSAGFYGHADIAESAIAIDRKLKFADDCTLPAQLREEIRELLELLRRE